MLLRENLRKYFRAALFSPGSVYSQAKLLSALARATKQRAPATDYTDRIVVVKLDRIGDFVMVTPFLRELRGNYPVAWITLVTSDLVHSLAAPCPYVNEVLVAARPPPGLRGTWHQWREWISLAWRHLLPLRPTLALLPRWEVDLYEAHALLAFTGAHRRVGYSVRVSPDKAQHNRGADRLFTTAVADAPGRHEVEKNLGLLRALGLRVEDDREELWPAAVSEGFVTRLLPGREDHFLVALCPLSAEAVKDWPLPRFLDVVRHFSNHPRVTFILLVGPEYAALSVNPAVRALPNLVPLAGRLPLNETAALLQCCDLVLTVDTGLMHIACALHRPLVLVSGLPAGQNTDSHYSPARFGPWQADCTLVAPLVPGGGARRIDTITVEQVITAVAARLPAL